MWKELFFALALAWTVPVSGAEADRAVVFMRSAIGFSESQIASVEAGDIVTKQLPTADKPEIAAVGAVRVRSDRAAMLQSVNNDYGSSRLAGAALEMGRFSRPPRVEDLAGLTLDEDSLTAVRECTPGDCSIKLPRSAMERLQREVDWRAKDAPT